MFITNKKIDATHLDEKVSRKVLGHGGSLMMVEVSFKKGGIGSIHSHVHEQISYISKGSFRVKLGEEIKILNKGDSFYVPAKLSHGVAALEDSVILDVFTPIRQDFL